MWNGEYHVLVEKVEDQLGVSDVAPSAMQEEQSVESFEFWNSEIRRVSCLSSFKSEDSNTNVSLLDHVNVVCSISNSKRRLAEIFLHLRISLLEQR